MPANMQMRLRKNMPTTDMCRANCRQRFWLLSRTFNASSVVADRLD
jgi:hypothetical protein